jgi:transposase
VSAGGAEWIHEVVREKAPQALICLDAFHVVKWAGEALDTVRRRLAADLRAAGKHAQAAAFGQGMWALRKDPSGPGPRQRARRRHQHLARRLTARARNSSRAAVH